MAIDHIATPAVPPATMTAPRFKSVEPGVLKKPFVTSYAAKYAALPGPSRAIVATEPRKTLRMPPSLYRCFTTSKTPVYCRPDPPWPCTCNINQRWHIRIGVRIHVPAVVPSPSRLERSLAWQVWQKGNQRSRILRLRAPCWYGSGLRRR